jgi:aryl-alcohol dehydrogenase-like predicted oxidoreductase
LGSAPSAGAYRKQDFSPGYLRKALEASLRRLGTDFVDLYQLHGPRAVHDDALALMSDLRCEGKIRGLGVGLEGLDLAEQWIDTGSLSGIQMPFGLLDPHAGDQVIPRAAAVGLPVIVRGVLAGGFVARPPGDGSGLLRPGQPARLTALSHVAALAGVSPMQLAVWFARAKQGVATVLVGTSSTAHLREVASYFELPPPADVLHSLAALLDDTAEV